MQFCSITVQGLILNLMHNMQYVHYSVGLMLVDSLWSLQSNLRRIKKKTVLEINSHNTLIVWRNVYEKSKNYSTTQGVLSGVCG